MVAALETIETVNFESVIYHIYKEIWTPVMSKDLVLRVEDGNEHHSSVLIKGGPHRILKAVLELYYLRMLHNLFNH